MNGTRIILALTITILTFQAMAAQVKMAIVGEWDSGFKGEITITNDQNKSIDGWHLSFTSDFQIDSLWNATLSKTGSQYTLSSLDWNTRIAPGKHIKVGFIGSPGRSAKIPKDFIFNANDSLDANKGFVANHGQLRVRKGKLVDRHGEPIQLRGISSHGLQWYAGYMNRPALTAFRDDWNINVIRAAMYTWEGGYIQNPDVEKVVHKIIDMAVDLDIYVIVDWHILIDHDPNIHIDQAIDFFDRLSKRYRGIPNILYEIANEPSGGGVWGDATFPGYAVTWKKHIKPYSEKVIPVIRGNAPNAPIIVGTGTWSQDVDIASADPLDFDNLLYAIHFYACDHGEQLRHKASTALARGLALFSSEWGTTQATGNGRVCQKESDTWLNFFDQHQISWVNWNISDKDESSAAFVGGTPFVPPDSGIWAESRLSESGRYVRQRLRNY